MFIPITMRSYNDRLAALQRKTDSFLCVGLDTDAEKLPLHLRGKKNGILEFNRQIIEATKDLACAYKINFAFYEPLGAEGWRIIEKTRALLPSTAVGIADAKRGDIGNTSEQYARAILQNLGYDAITVAPYMGRDSVEPFLQWKDKGVYLLALTSNGGAADFQHLRINKRTLYEQVVFSAQRWNHQDNLGFVVGATAASNIRTIRRHAAEIPFLVPGVGAQGGRVADVIRYGSQRDGGGLLINASRSILYASSGKDFADAARSEALKLTNEINFHRSALAKE